MSRLHLLRAHHHGTLTGYAYGCRCGRCSGAQSEAARKRYQRRIIEPRAVKATSIPGPGPWDRHAACADSTLPWTRDWPTDAEVAAMKAVCASCPVLADCTDYVLKHGGAGIIAGTTEKERKQLRKAQRGAA